MAQRIVIIGAGENAEVVRTALEERYTVVGYLADGTPTKKILGPIADFKRYITDHLFFISIGNNTARKRIFEELQKMGANFVNAIHPLAHLEKTVKLGENVFIGAMSYVNVNTVLGNGVFINNACVVEHDNIVGDFTHLAPGTITGGGVTIGGQTFIGLGARINDHLTIGHDVVVGSGSVVIKALPDSCTAVGVPARTVKESLTSPS